MQWPSVGVLRGALSWAWAVWVSAADGPHLTAAPGQILACSGRRVRRLSAVRAFAHRVSYTRSPTHAQTHTSTSASHSRTPTPSVNSHARPRPHTSVTSQTHSHARTRTHARSLSRSHALTHTRTPAQRAADRCSLSTLGPTPLAHRAVCAPPVQARPRKHHQHRRQIRFVLCGTLTHTRRAPLTHTPTHTCRMPRTPHAPHLPPAPPTHTHTRTSHTSTHVLTQPQSTSWRA